MSLYIYEVMEIYNMDKSTKVGQWIIQDFPIPDRFPEDGIYIQKGLDESEGKTVDLFKGKFIGEVEGHTKEDMDKAFESSFDDGLTWLESHGIVTKRMA